MLCRAGWRTSASSARDRWGSRGAAARCPPVEVLGGCRARRRGRPRRSTLAPRRHVGGGREAVAADVEPLAEAVELVRRPRPCSAAPGVSITTRRSPPTSREVGFGSEARQDRLPPSRGRAGSRESVKATIGARGRAPRRGCAPGRGPAWPSGRQQRAGEGLDHGARQLGRAVVDDDDLRPGHVGRSARAGQARHFASNSGWFRCGMTMLIAGLIAGGVGIGSGGRVGPVLRGQGGEAVAPVGARRPDRAPVAGGGGRALPAGQPGDEGAADPARERPHPEQEQRPPAAARPAGAGGSASPWP